MKLRYFIIIGIVLISLYFISAPFPTTNLLHLYEVDEGASATGIILDEVGTSDGINNGSTNVSGILNSAYDFNAGELDWIDFGFQWVDDSAGSVCSWLNPDNTNVEIIINDRTSTGEYFQLAQVSGAFYFRINDGTTHDISGNTSYSVGSWSLLCGTWGAAGMKLYMNGDPIGTNAYTGGWVSNSNMVIGRADNGAGAWQYWNGQGDQTSFFDSQINISQIQEIYNSGSGVQYGEGVTDNTPTVTLYSPVEGGSSDVPVNFTCSASDDFNLTNNSLYLDGVLNETNSSGIEGNYSFSKYMSYGSHNWSCEAYDNASQSTKPIALTFTVEEQRYTLTNTSWHTTSSDGVELYCNIYLNSTNLYNPFIINTDTWSNSSTRTPLIGLAQTYEGYGYFSTACETRGKGDSTGTADASGYEQRDMYEIIEALIAEYPTYINSSQIYIYGESGAGGKAYMFGVKYPDYANAISPISGMTNYSLWCELNSDYCDDIQYRINTTGNIDDEGYNSRNTIFGIQNIYSMYAPGHASGDFAVNVTLSRNFNETMNSIGKGNLVNYTEVNEVSHGSTTETLENTKYAFDNYRDPIIIPETGNLKILGYVHSKRFRVEFLETINKVGDVNYNFSNTNYLSMNISTISYTGNASISIYGVNQNNFNVYRNGNPIISVINGELLQNSYQASYYPGDNLTFVAPDISSDYDLYEIIYPFQTGRYWTSDLDEGLIAVYHFDEQDTTGTGTIVDSIGTNDGTNDGADNITGIRNTAYDFTIENTDKISGIIDLPYTNFSLFAWIKLKSNNTDQPQIIYSATDGANQIISFLISTNGELQLIIRDTSGAGLNATTSTQTLNTETWYQVGAVLDGNQQKIYINGINVKNSTYTGGSWSDGSTPYFGAYDPTSIRNYFNGTMDEVFFFNRTLNDQNISYIYNNIVVYGDTAPITDTCTYSSGNWNIDLSDNCVITNNQDASSNACILTGSGSFTIDGGNVICKSWHFIPDTLDGTNIISIINGGRRTIAV